MADAPKSFIGIMVSSTFTDLEEHRQEVSDAIAKLGFHPVGMEDSGANAAQDVIATSLEMVRDCSAYVLVISHKYGQTPVDPVRNPDGLSITELEFNEAVRQERPRLLFIMGEKHPVILADVEDDAAKKVKLRAFKERAKLMCPAVDGATVHCIYEMFDSKAELGKSATVAIARHAIRLEREKSGQPGNGPIDPAEFAKLFEGVRAEAERKNIDTQAVLALASKVAENVPDTVTAIAELNNAIDEYLRIRESLAKGSNFSDEIDEAINRVQAKIASNDFDGALAQGEVEYRLLEEREAELSAAKIRLAQINIANARIAYDATTMARWIAAKLELENGGSAITATQLRNEQNTWFEKSLKHGSRLEMDVAIALARLSLGATQDPQMIANCQIDLGNALKVQGERQGGEAGLLLLGEAVTAHRAALEVHARDDMPVDWAMTQNNLGNTLSTQGEWQGGKAGLLLLSEAVTAYRAALEVYTRDDMPVQWAATQNNLGNALTTQGERQGGEAGLLLLGEAVTAFRAALVVRTRADMPVDWAMTQNNLGIALRVQGQQQGGEAGLLLLGEAVTACRAALEVCTRDDMPVRWAMMHINLGVALRVQGERQGGEAGLLLLGEAVTAYRAALEVYTRDDMPVQWATTQNNLGNALLTQGKQGGEAGLLLQGEAVTAYRAALEVYTRHDMPVQWAMTRENVGLALQEMAGLDAARRCELLREARTEIAAGLEVFTPDHMPFNWEKASRSLADIDAEIAKDC